MMPATTTAFATARKFRCLPLAGVLALCLSLQSCFTAGLWRTDLRGHDKAYLTPLSLTLDLITLPIQIAVLDGGHHHHHHR
jgi:hypothetical protein